MGLALIKSKWENGGCLVFRTLDNYIVDIWSSRALILNPMHAGTIGTGAYFGGQWLVSAVNSGTVAGGDVVTLTTGAADNDDTELASSIGWNAAQGLSLECHAAPSSATCGFCIGFSDAQGEDADKLAITFDTATATTNASDAALFYHDYDATSKVIRAMTVNDDTDSTILASTTAATAATYNKYRIDVDLDGNADFWLDDVKIGTADTAVRSAVNLCAYVGLINRDGNSRSLAIKDLAVWQWRS